MGFGKLLDRPLGYKVGLGALMFGSFLYLLGYSIPAWHNREVNKLQIYQDGYMKDNGPISTVYIYGLWGSCKLDFSDCSYYLNFPGWLTATRFMCSVSFILMAVAHIRAIMINICSPCGERKDDDISVEICASLAGLCGIIGNIIYAASVKQESSENGISWAFAINCIGGILVLVSGLLVAVSHGKSEEQKGAAAWPYGMGTGLNSSFQQETQLNGFPEVDNPAFTDPSQIRFVRTTRPSSSSVEGSIANSYQPQVNNSRAAPNRRRPGNDPFNTSAYDSEIGSPPSYESVISSERDLGDGNPYPYQSSGYSGSREVSI